MEFEENEHRTLMDKARSMLSGAGLTQEFWVEAVDMTKYLVNRSPSLVLVSLKRFKKRKNQRR
jgi:hypothetical protein